MLLPRQALLKGPVLSLFILFCPDLSPFWAPGSKRANGDRTGYFGKNWETRFASPRKQPIWRRVDAVLAMGPRLLYCKTRPCAFATKLPFVLGKTGYVLSKAESVGGLVFLAAPQPHNPTPEAQRLEKINLDWNFQSRLKFSIPDLQNSPQKIGVWWVARLKISISIENFNPGGRSWIFSIFGPLGNCSEVGNGPNTVSRSTVSNTELSEFFGAHWVPGSELSEFLSAFSLCAKANSPSFSQNSPSLPENSVGLSEFSSPKQYSRNSIPPVS